MFTWDPAVDEGGEPAFEDLEGEGGVVAYGDFVVESVVPEEAPGETFAGGGKGEKGARGVGDGVGVVDDAEVAVLEGEAGEEAVGGGGLAGLGGRR